jgi:hypothetical protein
MLKDCKRYVKQQEPFSITKREKKKTPNNLKNYFFNTNNNFSLLVLLLDIAIFAIFFPRLEKKVCQSEFVLNCTYFIKNILMVYLSYIFIFLFMCNNYIICGRENMQNNIQDLLFFLPLTSL